MTAGDVEAALRRENVELPLVLAGGLDPANVAEAVRRVRPWAVDVSGGVEVLGVDGRRQGGIKDPGAVSAFIRAARG